MAKSFCRTCGEESGAQGSSMYGSVHKYGPTTHWFEDSRKPSHAEPDEVSWIGSHSDTCNITEEDTGR